MVIVRWPNKGAMKYVCVFLFSLLCVLRVFFLHFFSVSCDFLDGSEIVVHPDMSVGEVCCFVFGSPMKNIN